MAPAMAERRPEDVTYRDLGDRKATLARSIEAGMLPRLAELGQVIVPAEARFEFGLRDNKPSVQGSVSVRMSLPCQWCERSLERQVQAEFSVLLAVDEAQAVSWDSEPDHDDVIVVAGERLDPAGLIEDELLMSIPLRVCEDDNCPSRPGSGKSDREQTAESPFKAMAELLRNTGR
jgi:uncharacterized metal-binding protein YceD (DUF177 family)